MRRSSSSRWSPSSTRRAPATRRCRSRSPASRSISRGPLRAINLTLASEDGETLIDGVNFAVDLPARVAIVGPSGSGKEELTLLLANLIDPTAGRVLIGERELHKLPEAVTGRQITYVGYPAQIFAGSIADNLFFGLKHRPVAPYEPDGAAAEQHKHELPRGASARAIRPSTRAADWIDYRAAGVDGPDAITRGRRPRARPWCSSTATSTRWGCAARSMPRRSRSWPRASSRRAGAMGERLQDPKLGRLVEMFDPERYNTNATLAENLLFGTPIGEAFDFENLAAHPYVQQIIAEAGLAEALLEVGFQLASTMVELFADLPPDHEYFRQFSFISADDLPDYRALISRADPAKLAS